MSKATLGISWLNGVWKAVSIRSDRVAGSWTSPKPVDRVEEIGEALREAVTETGFVGQEVVFVLDHRSFIYHIQETPPAKKRLVLQILNRIVSASQFFEEPAAWGYVQLPSNKGKQRFLLSLIPRSLLDGMELACRNLNLQLTAVFPAYAVLGSQLAERSTSDDDHPLIAAEIEGVLCLLAGRGDGQVLFTRSVSRPQGSADSLAFRERAEQEINRTVLFAQQQFGVNISGLWLFGAGAAALLQGVNLQKSVPVRTQGEQEDEFYFARAGASLSPSKNTTNLVSQAEVTGKRAKRYAALAVAALWIAALTLTISVEIFAQIRQRYRAAEDASFQEAATQRVVLLEQAGEIQRLESIRRWIEKGEQPPIAELFLRNLSAILPEPMTLTSVQLTRDTNGWRVAMHGVAKNSNANALPLTEALEERLSNSVFAVQVSNSSRMSLFQGGEAELQPVANRGADVRPFFVEGVIQ